MIERVEPRHGVLTRASRRREHVLVANVDQVAIVVSLVEPDLKPHLIDRYLAPAQQGGLKPLVLLNKADLADPVELQPLIGGYAQLGITALLTSATTGAGLDRLREQLRGRATVFSGQSGVGKSSLLNAVDLGAGHVRQQGEVFLLGGPLHAELVVQAAVALEGQAVGHLLERGLATRRAVESLASTRSWTDCT